MAQSLTTHASRHRNPGGQSEEAFKRVQAAYRTLVQARGSARMRENVWNSADGSRLPHSASLLLQPREALEPIAAAVPSVNS